MVVQWLRDVVAPRVYGHRSKSEDDEAARQRQRLEAEQRELESRVRVAEALRDALIIARNR